MSYTVGLFPGRVSSDDAEAFRAFERTNEASRPGEPASPVLAQVHAELTARFPCICDLPDEELDAGVWSDGPLINNFGQQTAVIGCVGSAVAEVVPFIYAVAGRHGVTVFDWQTGRVVRPEG